MSNVLKVTEALSEWVMNVAKSVLPHIHIPPTSPIAGAMQFLGIDLRTYNVYDELGFIIEPTLKRYLEPMLTKFLNGLGEDDVKDVVMTYAEAFRKQAADKGFVDIFGVQLGESAFVGLIEILNQKLR